MSKKTLYLAIFAGMFISASNADVPVVDDSENYAFLEQQAATTNTETLAQEEDDSFFTDDQALARDSNPQPVSEEAPDPLTKVKNLRQEVQELRGQIEIITHELEKLKEQQITFYKDLDSRIPSNTNVQLSDNTPEQNKEATKDPTTQQPIQALLEHPENKKTYHPTTNTSPADEQISYLQAYELIKNKEFTKAVGAMQSFVNKYPQGYYTANAQYWLGELFLAQKNYPDAITHFDIVLNQYPTSNKYSASLLKMGYALADSGHLGEAKEKLREVLKKYPDTNTSVLARNKLEEITSNI